MTRNLMILLACLGLLAACGKKPPPEPAPQNKAPRTPAVNVHAPRTSTDSAKPKGKSYLTEYIKAKNEAFEAKKRYDAVRRDPAAAKGALNEPYIEWAEAMFEALACANMHEKNGHSLSDLPELRELKRLKTDDFKNALGPMDDPRVKAAMKKVEDSAK